jgi:hypothetical protein
MRSGISCSHQLTLRFVFVKHATKQERNAICYTALMGGKPSCRLWKERARYDLAKTT